MFTTPDHLFPSRIDSFSQRPPFWSLKTSFSYCLLPSLRIYELSYVPSKPLYVCICSHPHTSHLNCPFHPHSIIIKMFSEQYKWWSSALSSFLQCPVICSTLGPNIFVITLFPNTLVLIWQTKFRIRIKYRGNIYFILIICIILEFATAYITPCISFVYCTSSIFLYFLYIYCSLESL